ncbi:MAG: zf-HC2 domain-containing protein [Actinomycetota bacterium]|nr:zf-HC2 domain-containing protein [Actinomycetota bacterium]
MVSEHERVREELSARLDGELSAHDAREVDDHLSNCADCRQEFDALSRVRAVMRIQGAERVPNLTSSVMERVRREAPRISARREWWARGKVAAVGAAASILFLVGTGVPWVERPPDAARADEIVREIRSTARHLQSYEAAFSIFERGWHEEVPVRRFAARLSFSAPESVALHIADETLYPGQGWPRNSVDLVSDGRRWSLREPSSCPPVALPGCLVKPSMERRSLIHRKPFDGSSPLPIDLIVPLESLAGSSDLEVLGTERVLGRGAHRVVLPYRQAEPLIQALQPGGSWRPFHPLDPVQIWVDEDSGFPLRFEVRAGSSADRDGWEVGRGLDDRTGELLLAVRATSFSAGDHVTPAARFRSRARGVVSDGGFRREVEAAAAFELSDIAGLRPYQAGTIGATRVLAYASGMTWLRIESRRAEGPIQVPATAEEVMLAGGYAYYQPADRSFRRRLDIFGTRSHIHLESNLPRAELLAAAELLDEAGRRAPPVVHVGGSMTIARLTPDEAARLGFVELPAYLPDGHEISSASLTSRHGRARTLTLQYRSPDAGYEPSPIRITQSSAVQLLPPSSEQFVAVRVGDVPGRWSPERAELEWIDDGTYRAVAVPSFDLATALEIAEGLR